MYIGIIELILAGGIAGLYGYAYYRLTRSLTPPAKDVVSEEPEKHQKFSVRTNRWRQIRTRRSL